jgi:HAD superfamily hydrolase (TIGR01548 family)
MKPGRDGATLPLNILVFDMDGVLIDVSKSYRKTIEETIRIYLETCLQLRGVRRKPALDRAVSLFKAAGGFNNDWDLTSGLLLYLLSLSGLPASLKRKEFSSIPETVAYLRGKSSGVSAKIPAVVNLGHLSSFLEGAKTSGQGLKGIRRALQGSWEGWVYGCGDLDQTNVIKRIFQEVYLGRKFTSCYPLKRLFYRGNGYFLRERMLISVEVLSAFRRKILLGIATGRPRFEAELALKRFHLLSRFKSIVTLDECLEEERRLFRSTGKRLKRTKPHPFPLLKAIEEIGIPVPRCGYVGDAVDDIRAARTLKKKTPVLAIGYIPGPRNRTLEKALKEAGADRLIRSPKELLRFVASFR